MLQFHDCYYPIILFVVPLFEMVPHCRRDAVCVSINLPFPMCTCKNHMQQEKKGTAYLQSLQLTNGERGFFVNTGSSSGEGRLVGFDSESELRQKYQTSVA